MNTCLKSELNNKYQEPSGKENWKLVEIRRIWNKVDLYLQWLIPYLGMLVGTHVQYPKFDCFDYWSKLINLL